VSPALTVRRVAVIGAPVLAALLQGGLGLIVFAATLVALGYVLARFSPALEPSAPARTTA
jgi:hypothetical protein